MEEESEPKMGWGWTDGGGDSHWNVETDEVASDLCSTSGPLVSSCVDPPPPPPHSLPGGLELRTYSSASSINRLSQHLSIRRLTVSFR